MKTTETTDKKQTWPLFNQIAHTYDPLNRILSFGQDQLWRRKVASHLPKGQEIKLLDLATGTGDLLHALCKQEPRIQEALGLDLAEEMLKIGEKKHLDSEQKVEFRLGDATDIECPENEFDAVSIAFGIRNVGEIDDVKQSMREMLRVLKPSGKVLILEFSMPESKLIRVPYLFYFRQVLPRVGGWVSKEPEAYRYLNQSVEAFPYGQAFCELLQDAGFENVKAIPMTFGVATLYIGEKPSNNESQQEDLAEQSEQNSGIQA